MLKRILKLDNDYSILLFGPRGVGKSTLVRHDFDKPNTIYIDLLNPLEEDKFSRNPNELIAIVEAMDDAQTHVIIDEVQKVPKLLDVIHLLIESEKYSQYFVLTGSSARKLKMQGVNLLAGRAFVYSLHAYSYLEISEKFNLDDGLTFGMLPKVFEFAKNSQKELFLRSYATTYLKEEIWAEHLIKKLEPFRKFLEVASQCNGKIINYSNLSRDVGADEKTIKNYFSILEDTLLGFMVEPFHHSFRKRLSKSPKFYFFDVGVARVLSLHLSLIPKKGTSYYGELFENFIVIECIKLASYYKPDYKFSYLRSHSGFEIDLVIERPGLPLLLIEIKSKTQVILSDCTHLTTAVKEIQKSEAIILSNDPVKKQLGDTVVYPWQEGIKKYFSA